MENNYSVLYNEVDRGLMKVSEDSLNPKVDRVDEIIAYAREAGFQRIGIANCISFEKESEVLDAHLCKQGFTVFRANCKLGRMPNSDILPGYKGTSCNPAGQAAFLADNKTELNLVMGLCLGHEIVFNSKSKALTTTLIVKDRKLKHHTLTRLRDMINEFDASEETDKLNRDKGCQNEH